MIRAVRHFLWYLDHHSAGWQTPAPSCKAGQDASGGRLQGLRHRPERPSAGPEEGFR